MNSRNITMIMFAASAFSGCASITSSELQTVSLNASSVDGRSVDKATCSLQNDKGSWQMDTPGQIAVRRSAEDLMVECKKEGFADGSLRAISRAAPGMFGNVIFGGGIGAIIDHNKGTGYDYPNELPVTMGASTTIDKRQKQPQRSNPVQTQDQTALGNN